jgi:putative transposase
MTCPRNLHQARLEKFREWKEQVEMRKSRHAEEQVIGAFNQMKAGRKAKELSRELCVSEATLYAWKSKYGGLEVNEARRLHELEPENARLKKLVADFSLDCPASAGNGESVPPLR